MTRALVGFVRRAIDKPPDFLKADGPRPKEEDLQTHLHDWLEYGADLLGSARREVPEISGGRVDIEYTQDNESLTIECKRELKDASRSALENAYSAQASSYSASRHRLAIVATLDLARDRDAPPPDYRSCIWIQHQSTQDGGNVLLHVVIPGNRVAPSDLPRRR